MAILEEFYQVAAAHYIPFLSRTFHSSQFQERFEASPRGALNAGWVDRCAFFSCCFALSAHLTVCRSFLSFIHSFILSSLLSYQVLCYLNRGGSYLYDNNGDNSNKHTHTHTRARARRARNNFPDLSSNQSSWNNLNSELERAVNELSDPRLTPRQTETWTGNMTWILSIPLLTSFL